MVKLVEFKGLIYKGFKSCWEVNATEGLSYQNAVARKKRGWSIEDALTTPVKGIKAYTVDGISYQGLSALAKSFCIRRSTIQNRVKLGYSDQELVYGKDTGVRLDNISYKSINQMCEAHGVNSDTYLKRLKGGWTQEEALGLVERATAIREGKSFTVQGKKYPSIKALSKAFKVPFSTIRNRMAKGYSINVALGLEPIPRKPIVKTLKYELEGKVYKSLGALAEAVGISEGTLYDRMKHHHLSLKEAVNFKKSSADSVICHGKEFTSFKDLAKHYNKDYYPLVQRINRYKMTPEEAITIPDEKDPIVLEGEVFTNFNDAARHYGISIDVARLRLSRGYSVEEALELEGDGFVRKGIYNENYFERNPGLADRPALIYFVQFLNNISGNSFQKIGITKRSVDYRFQSGYQDYKLEVLNTLHCTLKEAYMLEQMLHFEFNSYAYLAPYSFVGRTECFKFNANEISRVNEIIDRANCKILGG